MKTAKSSSSNRSNLSLALPKDHKLSKAYIRSPLQEREIAARIGGGLTLLSGAMDEKGDVRKRNAVRIEAKTTQAKRFYVTLEMINKIETAALSSGELPVIEVEFLDSNGRTINSICVVPKLVIDMICDWSKNDSVISQ